MLKEIKLNTAQRNEMLDLTPQLNQFIKEIKAKSGLLSVYSPHTTSGITINENADPSVVYDLLHALDKLIPRLDDYRHAEGNSDAHLKSSLVGCSEQIMVENGELMLGTWQGVFFCEFDGPRSRRVWLKFIPA